MRKFLTFVVLPAVILVAVWTGLSTWCGKKIEEGYRTDLGKVVQSKFLKVTLDSYRRGIWTSEAKVTAELVFPEGKNTSRSLPVRIAFTHQIYHGPIPIARGPGDRWTPKPLIGLIKGRASLSSGNAGWARGLAESFPELNDMELVAVLYMTGEGEGEFKVPAIKKTFPEKENAFLNSEGISTRFKFSADMQHLAFSFSVPGIETGSSQGTLRIKGVTSGANLREGVYGLYFGDFFFDVPAFEFLENRQGGKTSLLLSGTRWESSDKLTGNELIDSSLALKVERMVLNGQPFGPGRLGLELRRLDAESIARFKTEMQELSGREEALSPEDFNTLAGNAAIGMIGALLGKSPEIELTGFNLATPLGDASGKAKIGFDGPKAARVLNPLLILGALSAECELSASEGIARAGVRSMLRGKAGEQGPPPSDDDVTKTLHELRVEELIVKEDESYAARASFKDGKLVLNGREIPLSSLLK